MKLLLVLASVLGVSVADYCYNDVIAACKPAGGADLINCNAKYGHIEDVAYDLQSFANKHITHSFQYLLLSTHFKNYEKNREGFGKMFRKLSDTAWEDGIELIKYMTKRGVAMDFLSRVEDRLANPKDDTYELYELESLSKSLDIQVCHKITLISWFIYFFFFRNLWLRKHTVFTRRRKTMLKLCPMSRTLLLTN